MKRTISKADAVLPGDVVENLLKATKPAGLTEKRRTAMRQKLLAAVATGVEDPAIDKDASMRIVRAGEGSWITFAPNVEMKVLNDDGHTRTWLARFAAGGRIPAHRQTGDEEAIVLEGWCYVGEHEMHKGDYQLIRKGGRHGEIASPDGCLIFVRSHSDKKRASDLAVTR
ncbi:MAG: cupin domain-containing protein [Betaproteobacteria bacterium]